MKADNISYSSAVLRFVTLFILLASLLVLPNSGCNKKQHTPDIRISFRRDQLEYTVLTEDLASKTGTVSVRAASNNISGVFAIPSSFVGGREINYSVTVIPAHAFAVCNNLTSIIIPDSVTEIGVAAFSGCASLTSINIPDSVTEIGEMEFCGCSSLTSIAIPDSVTSIGNWAFPNCRKLVSETIGKSVASIGKEAFKDCSSLTDVYFKGNAPKLPEENVFFAPSVIHYKPGTTGWTNPWDGRPTKEWVE